jgi:hypothetical protein
MARLLDSFQFGLAFTMVVAPTFLIFDLIFTDHVLSFKAYYGLCIFSISLSAGFYRLVYELESHD